MKAIQYFTLLLLAAVCFACGGHTYYLKTDNAAGLEAGDPVLRQGVPIGEVEDVRFADRRVEIEIQVEEPMYEGQSFIVRRNDYGSEVELTRPRSSASELAEGATVTNSFGMEFGEELGEALVEALALKEEALANSLEGLSERLSNSAEGWDEGIEERAD
ncbi:MAG: MlaD family protein, partial [Bacteroidota bacterium]